MSSRPMFALILLLALAGRREAIAAEAGPRCAAGERPVYACPFGKSAVSVCATDRTVTYRHATGGKTDLTIVSTGKDGRASQTTIVGGGGGHQTALRFSNAGHDFIVYSAIYGALTEVAGTHASGLVVMQGGRELSNRACPVTSKAQHLDDALSFVPETNSASDGWY